MRVFQLTENALDINEREALARSDGFPNFAVMMNFWKGRLPFRGDMIHWNPDQPQDGPRSGKNRANAKRPAKPQRVKALIMPTLTYMLELTEAELLHLWTLYELRTLRLGPSGTEEDSILEKVRQLEKLAHCPDAKEEQ